MSVSDVVEKACVTCGEVKPLSDFGKHKRQPDGLHYSCGAQGLLEV